MRRVPASRRIAARGQTLRHVSELSQWNAGPSWPSINSVRIASSVSRRSSRGAQKIESPLSYPDLEASSPTSPIPPLESHHGRQSTARTPPGSGDLQLWQARELLGTKVSEPVHASDSASACEPIARARRDRAEIRTEMSAGVPPSPSSSACPTGRNNTAHRAHPRAFPACRLKASGARALWLQDDQDVVTGAASDLRCAPRDLFGAPRLNLGISRKMSRP